MTLPRRVFQRLASELAREDEEEAVESRRAVSGLVVDRYELVERVGEGSGGVVWRAWDPLFEREAAVKVLRESVDEEAEANAADLAPEFAAMARLRGPGFAELFDVGVCPVEPEVLGGGGGSTERHAFCAMEWVPGASLADRLTRGPLPPVEAARTLRDVARTLAEAHRAGILHLDLNPSNILLGSGGPKLVDFGAMRALFGAAGGARRPIGTRGFLAPEQALGRESEIGPRSDVHGLGATLAAALTGSPEPEEAALERVDPALAAISRRARAQDPEERYPDASAFVHDLDAWLRSAALRDTASNRSRRIAYPVLAALFALALFFFARSRGPDTMGELSTAAAYDELLASLRADSGATATELLRARAGAILADFSFHPADLDALSDRGELESIAASLTDLPGAPLPSELAVLQRLAAYIDGEVPGRSDLVDRFPTSRFARLESAMEALVEEEPARAALDVAPLGLDDPNRRLLDTAIDFQMHGAGCDREFLTSQARTHPFLASDLGLLALLEGDARAALEHFETALASHPTLATAAHHRIVALWRLGQPESARRALAEFVGGVEADPDEEWDEEGADGWSLAARSSSVYLWPSRARLESDPWLAEFRAEPGIRALLGGH
ncbi:MAG TPA: serine/threonine protein kinase [Planctomycetes bacterium]|nr:serine/threonine protein kinase [Planctomycetota bacterium]